MDTKRDQAMHDDPKMARDRELLAKFLTDEKRKEQDTTLKVLDTLRRTRRARGGVGEPLKVPAHLRMPDQGIIITDAELNDGFDKTNSEGN